MNKNGKLISLLLLMLSIGLFAYVGSSIGGLVQANQQTLDFQDSNNITNLEVEETTTFYLLSDFSSGNNASSFLIDYECTSRFNNNYTTLVCDNYSQDHENTVILQVENTETNKFYIFADMGNTEVTINDYKSVAKIELPPGSYQISTTSSTFDYDVNFKLQDTELLVYILKTVVIGIIAICSFVGFIIAAVLSKKVKSHSNDYDYYDSQIKEQDHNSELFDEDDPFSKYD
jgi:hypothetical protein